MGKGAVVLDSPTTGGMVDLEPVDAVMRRGDLRFVVLTIGALFITHAIAFFLHEYSHATLAWLLGYKTNPLNINYGHLDLSNILLQQEIDENVSYKPIFDANHGNVAAAIALAGAGIGNGVFYLACALILRKRLWQMRPATALFLFWLTLMASGNLWSYAPVRTVTTHGDMALAAYGLGISPWTLFPFVVLPSFCVGWDFFARLLPLVLGRACGSNVLHRVFASVLACFIFFGFYGGCPAVGGNYGDVSAVFSIASLFVLFPIVVMVVLAPIRVEQAGLAD